MKIQHFILIIVLLLSCNKQADIPPELYNRETMANIMADVYVLEFKVKELPVKQDSLEKIFNIYEKELFEEKGYDSAKYRKSLEFYIDQPDHIEFIYSIIADSLSLRNKIVEYN